MPTLIGHRGLGRGVVDGHPQNTLGSFLAALGAGVSWVEVDVRRTADDALVVAHDAAYPDGAFLVDLTAEQVRARGTLALADLLAALPPGAGVSLDLKTCMEDAVRPPERTTAALLAPVAGQELQRRPLWLSSFDPAALLLVREACPQVPLGLLTWHGYPTEHAVAAAAHLDVQVLALQVGSLWPDTVPEALPEPVPRAARRPLPHVLSLLHRSGRQLAVWCPRLQHARQLVSAGVDALVLDDVPRTARALQPTP
jgi:glycerophosphoryl diester phosphodiesterase